MQVKDTSVRGMVGLRFNILCNPLHTIGLFRHNMLDKSICHFRAVWTIFPLLFFFENLLPVMWRLI